MTYDRPEIVRRWTPSARGPRAISSRSACGGWSGTRRWPSGSWPPAPSTRFAGEGQETAVEFFDRDRFSSYASIGENILVGHSAHAALAL
jgi:hypothetical protein